MILIAEDNPLMRKILRSLVEDIDSEIVECEDGAAAVLLFEKHRPDWVLMDIEMHPVDGLSATREIIARHPTANIIVVNEYDDAAIREQAFKAGACEFFGKGDLLPLRRLIGGQSVPKQ